MINLAPLGPVNLAREIFLARIEASKRPELPPSRPGPELVHLDDGWVPQGQALDAGEEHVFTTYNQDRTVIVSIQDADSTEGEIGHVELGAPPPPDHLHGWERTAFAAGASGPSKGGGIAIDGDNVYVADTQGVYRYSLEEMQGAAPGETVPALDFQATDHNASYVTVHDGHVYVGQFAAEEGGIGSDKYSTEPLLTRYEIGDDGRLVNPTGPIETPPYAQGVVVTEHGLLYTTSYSSDPDKSPHALVFQPFSDFGAFQTQTRSIECFGISLSESQVFHEVLTLDYYAEEVNIVGDEIWITYESNSPAYRENYENNIGETPDNGSIQRIPLSALDLSGTGVSAEQLEAAARD